MVEKLSGGYKRSKKMKSSTGKPSPVVVSLVVVKKALDDAPCRRNEVHCTKGKEARSRRGDEHLEHDKAAELHLVLDDLQSIEAQPRE